MEKSGHSRCPIKFHLSDSYYLLKTNVCMVCFIQVRCGANEFQLNADMTWSYASLFHSNKSLQVQNTIVDWCRFHRVEVLGALVSVLSTWLVTGILLWEAVLRVMNPEPVNGKRELFINPTSTNRSDPPFPHLSYHIEWPSCNTIE